MSSPQPQAPREMESAGSIAPETENTTSSLNTVFVSDVFPSHPQEKVHNLSNQVDELNNFSSTPDEEALLSSPPDLRNLPLHNRPALDSSKHNPSLHSHPSFGSENGNTGPDRSQSDSLNEAHSHQEALNINTHDSDSNQWEYQSPFQLRQIQTEVSHSSDDSLLPHKIGSSDHEFASDHDPRHIIGHHGLPPSVVDLTQSSNMVGQDMMPSHFFNPAQVKVPIARAEDFDNTVLPGLGSVVATDNSGFLCSKLPQHWRSNKSLPEQFKIISLVDIPNGTEVVLTLTPDPRYVHSCEPKNNTTTFLNRVAKFCDLRFLGKSGRGNLMGLTFTIRTHPIPLVVTISNAIKITVDGPRGPRLKLKGDQGDPHSPHSPSSPNTPHKYNSGQSSNQESTTHQPPTQQGPSSIALQQAQIAIRDNRTSVVPETASPLPKEHNPISTSLNPAHSFQSPPLEEERVRHQRGRKKGSGKKQKQEVTQGPEMFAGGFGLGYPQSMYSGLPQNATSLLDPQGHPYGHAELGPVFSTGSSNPRAAPYPRPSQTQPYINYEQGNGIYSYYQDPSQFSYMATYDPNNPYYGLQASQSKHMLDPNANGSLSSHLPLDQDYGTQSLPHEGGPFDQDNAGFQQMWPVLPDFHFVTMHPSTGREGDRCSVKLNFGRVPREMEIGFGLLFGQAVPSFDDDMLSEIDQVHINFRIPPMSEAMSQVVEVVALFRLGEQTYRAVESMQFMYIN